MRQTLRGGFRRSGGPSAEMALAFIWVAAIFVCGVKRGEKALLTAIVAMTTIKAMHFMIARAASTTMTTKDSMAADVQKMGVKSSKSLT